MHELMLFLGCFGLPVGIALLAAMLERRRPRLHGAACDTLPHHPRFVPPRRRGGGQ